MNSYYFIDSNKMQQGPIEADKLTNSGVTAETKVWTEGMSEWLPAGIVPELQEYFPKAVNNTPPPFNPTQSMQQNPNNNMNPNHGNNMPPKPDNNLVWAILCLVMCCQVFGIISLVKACEVDSLYNQGNYNGAVEAAESAKKWALWGAIIGCASTVIIFILYFFCGLASVLAQNHHF